MTIFHHPSFRAGMMPRYVPRTEASKKSPYDRRLKHLVGAGYAASFASVGNFSALFRNPSDRGTNDLGQSSLLPLDRGGPLCLCLYDTPVIFTFQPFFNKICPSFRDVCRIGRIRIESRAADFRPRRVIRLADAAGLSFGDAPTKLRGALKARSHSRIRAVSLCGGRA